MIFALRSVLLALTCSIPVTLGARMTKVGSAASPDRSRDHKIATHVDGFCNYPHMADPAGESGTKNIPIPGQKAVPMLQWESCTMDGVEETYKMYGVMGGQTCKWKCPWGSEHEVYECTGKDEWTIKSDSGKCKSKPMESGDHKGFCNSPHMADPAGQSGTRNIPIPGQKGVPMLQWESCTMDGVEETYKMYGVMGGQTCKWKCPWGSEHEVYECTGTDEWTIKSDSGKCKSMPMESAVSPDPSGGSGKCNDATQGFYDQTCPTDSPCRCKDGTYDEGKCMTCVSKCKYNGFFKEFFGGKSN